MATSRNPSIALSEQHRQLIDDLVASGRYQGVSEVVREGLRLLEDQETRRARILAEITRVVQERHRQRLGGRSGHGHHHAGAMRLPANAADAALFWTNAAVEDLVEILARSAERSSRGTPSIRIRQDPRAPRRESAHGLARPEPPCDRYLIFCRPLARGDGIDVLRIRPASSDWFGSLDLPTP